METSAGGLEARIAQAVAVVDGVGTVALFGSHATNRARPDSDLDVAVLPTKADPACRRRLVSRVAAALAGLAPGGRVDVVLVDEAPELLRQRIFEHGRLVMQRNPADWRAWRVRTMREHGDREPYRRMLRNAQARRLAAGGSVVDRDVLSTRLNALEGYLADLRPFAKRSRDEFVRESGLHHLAERLLHLACECVIDIAHHIIADEGYRQPSTYRDAIAVLAEEGVVDDALTDRVAAWVGFRNVLAHAYLDLDHGRSYDSIESDLGDLEDFARAVAKLLPDA